MSRPCTTCSLPAALRAELANSYFRHQRPLTRLVEEAAAAGYKIDRTTLHRHLSKCVAPPEDVSDATSSSGALVAFAVASVLGQRWPSLARQVADELVDLGAQDAARQVLANVDEWPESVRLLREGMPVGSDQRAVLEARGLARSINRVLAASDPSVAVALAADLRAHGLDELADAASAIHEPDHQVEESA